MHALGIPTTRALAVVATGEQVWREAMLPGAVLVRVAASHLRVGTFQYAAARGDSALLRRLADHAMRPSPPARGRGGQPVPRVLRGCRRRPGIADRSLDARRVHPRRHEHRQHDDLRRDHRLRPLRVHGCLRPRHRVQLDRSRRPLRLRQPAGRSRSGTWRGSPRPCCPSSTPRPKRPCGRDRRAAVVPRPLSRVLGPTGCAPSSASSTPTNRTTR